MPTAVAVLVNGNVVASVTGNNSGSLDWQAMDLSAYQGQQAQLQVIDQSDGSNGWGHLIVDNPVLSDTRAVGWANQTGANLIVNGQVVRSATGNNSAGLDWASWNVSALQGQQAQVQIVDQNSGSDWGHTIADNFEQAGAPATSAAQRAHWIDWGNDFYAAVTYNDAPDGQRMMVGWMSNWDYAQSTPTGAWRGEQSVTRKLTLQSVNGRLRLIQTPVSLAKLVTKTTTIKPRAVSGTKTLAATGTALQIDATLRPATSDNFGIDVRVGPGQHTRIGYDTTHQGVVRRSHGRRGFQLQLRIRRRTAGQPRPGRQAAHPEDPRRLLLRRGLRQQRPRLHHRPDLPRCHQPRDRRLCPARLRPTETPQDRHALASNHPLTRNQQCLGSDRADTGGFRPRIWSEGLPDRPA